VQTICSHNPGVSQFSDVPALTALPAFGSVFVVWLASLHKALDSDDAFLERMGIDITNTATAMTVGAVSASIATPTNVLYGGIGLSRGCSAQA